MLSKQQRFLTSSGQKIKNSFYVLELLDSILLPKSLAVIKRPGHFVTNTEKTKGNHISHPQQELWLLQSWFTLKGMFPSTAIGVWKQIVKTLNRKPPLRKRKDSQIKLQIWLILSLVWIGWTACPPWFARKLLQNSFMKWPTGAQKKMINWGKQYFSYPSTKLHPKSISTVQFIQNIILGNLFAVLWGISHCL